MDSHTGPKQASSGSPQAGPGLGRNEEWKGSREGCTPQGEVRGLSKDSVGARSPVLLSC